MYLELNNKWCIFVSIWMSTKLIKLSLGLTIFHFVYLQINQCSWNSNVNIKSRYRRKILTQNLCASKQSQCPEDVPTLVLCKLDINKILKELCVDLLNNIFLNTSRMHSLLTTLRKQKKFSLLLCTKCWKIKFNHIHALKCADYCNSPVNIWYYRLLQCTCIGEWP